MEEPFIPLPAAGHQDCLLPHWDAGVDVCPECRVSLDGGQLPKACTVTLVIERAPTGTARPPLTIAVPGSTLTGLRDIGEFIDKPLK